VTSHFPPPKIVAAPAPLHRHTDRPFRGITMIIASTLFLASSDAMAKYLSRSLPAAEVTWIRFLVFVLIMLPIVLAPSAGNPMRSARPMVQVWRGLALLSSSIFFITGLSYLPIAEAAATAFIAPVFVTGLSILFLREKVGVRRWIATTLGLIGVLVVVRPGTSAFHPAAVFPILSALGWAAALVLTRKITGVDRAITTMAFSAVTGFLVISVIVPFYWVTPSWPQILLGVGIGVSSTMGHWIVVLAFRYADASVLAPFSYVQLVWVTLLGFIVFGEVPDLWTFVGAAIIISSGVYTAHRERLRRLRPALPAEPYPSV
jgi:drug/metabolite transporter (DMT)-like permease